MFSRPVAALVFALLLVHPFGALAQDAEPWPEKIYNPKPDPADVTLPMPCGGSMTFRRVDVPGEDVLSDRKIVIGGTDERFRLMEYSRYEYVAAGFSAPDKPQQRFYYLGKYEVTAQQLEALSGSCPKIGPEAPLPAVSVSWFDAVKFTDAYTLWLLKNAAGKLPKEDGVNGFVRLPTEAEWEFAARGGVLVSDSEFQETHFPMKDQLSRYVWFQGTKSSNGKLQPIGLLQPNPLGLYDILGNADEIVLDPFRVDKLGRLHGQAGGYVVKGGNYLTSEADVRAAYRQEIPPFDAAGNRRLRTVGFRLAIAAPIVTSARRLQELRAAWARLPESVALVPGGEKIDDPVEDLQSLIRGISDVDVRKRLEHLSSTLTSNIAARNEQRDRAAKTAIRLGAFLGRKLRDDNRFVNTLRTLVEGREQAGMDEDAKRAATARLEGAEKALEDNATYYADTVLNTSQDYSPDVVERQLQVLTKELELRNLQAIVAFADLFGQHVAAVRKGERPDRKVLLQQLSGVR